MEEQAPRPVPFAILVIGLTLAVGCSMWSGRQFFLYDGGILYGLVAGISLGATYTFIKQIKIRFSSKSDESQ